MIRFMNCILLALDVVRRRVPLVEGRSHATVRHPRIQKRLLRRSVRPELRSIRLVAPECKVPTDLYRTVQAEKHPLDGQATPLDRHGRRSSEDGSESGPQESAHHRRRRLPEDKILTLLSNAFTNLQSDRHGERLSPASTWKASRSRKIDSASSLRSSPRSHADGFVCTKSESHTVAARVRTATLSIGQPRPAERHLPTPRRRIVADTTGEDLLQSRPLRGSERHRIVPRAQRLQAAL